MKICDRILKLVKTFKNVVKEKENLNIQKLIEMVNQVEYLQWNNKVNQISKKYVPGSMFLWAMEGSKSHFMDCLQQSTKIKVDF